MAHWYYDQLHPRPKKSLQAASEDRLVPGVVHAHHTERGGWPVCIIEQALSTAHSEALPIGVMSGITV